VKPDRPVEGRVVQAASPTPDALDTGRRLRLPGKLLDALEAALKFRRVHASGPMSFQGAFELPLRADAGIAEGLGRDRIHAVLLSWEGEGGPAKKRRKRLFGKKRRSDTDASCSSSRRSA
jgi:hypothetical protein